MAPANNTVLISPSSIKNISEYYTTCTGVGPFTYDYESTLTDLNILNSTINNPIAVQTLGQLSCYKSTQIEVRNKLLILVHISFYFLLTLLTLFL